jgi:hypothetical protein
MKNMPRTKIKIFKVIKRSVTIVCLAGEILKSG